MNRLLPVLLGIALEAPVVPVMALEAEDFLTTPAAAEDEATRSERRETQAVEHQDDPDFGRITVADSPEAAFNALRTTAGCHTIQAKSGLAWIATGVAAYDSFTNPTASRIAKRQAYLRAFIDAKTQLATSLGGVGAEGLSRIEQAFESRATEAGDLTRLAQRELDSVSQAVDQLVKGFVVYDVNDDEANQTVSVSIVTSPRTRSVLERVGPGLLDAATLDAGLKQVFAELRSGVTPPVGGRFIRVGETGEMAFVGFGSSVVRSNSNPAVAKQLEIGAMQQAQMRARDALLGLIAGNQVTWDGAVTEESGMSLAEFAELSGADADADGVRVFDEAREHFFADLKAENAWNARRAGWLPLGTQTRQWLVDDNGVAYATAVLTASSEREARAAATPVVGGATAPAPVSPPAGQRPATTIERGPSGQVSDPEDL